MIFFSSMKIYKRDNRDVDIFFAANICININIYVSTNDPFHSFLLQKNEDFILTSSKSIVT